MLLTAEEMRFGTSESEAPRRLVAAGPLAFTVSGGSLANITWHGVEVVRGVNCLVRDENWGTCLAENAVELFDDASYSRKFSAGDGGIAAEFSVEASAVGLLTISAQLTALRDFTTNRAGLTLLHPVEGVAGAALTVTHPGGSKESSRFPLLISPSQPVFDIAGLEHEIQGVTVSITFEGEVFEMEDQRNWSDASYKTYCRPLALPRPFALKKGETITQTIRIRVSGEPVRQAHAPSQPRSRRMPEIMLAAEQAWLPDAAGTAMLAKAGLGSYLLRVDSGPGAAAALGAFSRLAIAAGAAADLEIVLKHGSAAEALQALAVECRAAGLKPRRVFALPEAYMKSYQPGEPQPPGAAPEDCVAAAAAGFPEAVIGAGMLTNFTELNRRRPSVRGGSYVTHASTAIVHAADDNSVFETLETLPQMFESGRQIAAGRPCRLGLFSIGMRSNPYGAGVAENPGLTRRAMAGHDPRQRGLFAAAYAIGVACAAAAGDVEAVALAAPAGHFGVMENSSSGIRLYPIFHALRALADIAGADVSLIPRLPAGVHALRSASSRIIAANCSLEEKPLRLEGLQRASLLGAASFEAAARDPGWISRSAFAPGAEIVLEPCACLFGTMLETG